MLEIFDDGNTPSISTISSDLWLRQHKFNELKEFYLVYKEYCSELVEGCGNPYITFWRDNTAMIFGLIKAYNEYPKRLPGLTSLCVGTKKGI